MNNRIIGVIFLALFITGCSSNVTVYNNLHNFNSEPLKEYSKEGKVCNYRVFFYKTDPANYTISKAARSSGIKEVIFVEQSHLSVSDISQIPFYGNLTIFKRDCLIVKGN
jgi:hypothetical protein